MNNTYRKLSDYYYYDTYRFRRIALNIAFIAAYLLCAVLGILIGGGDYIVLFLGLPVLSLVAIPVAFFDLILLPKIVSSVSDGAQPTIEKRIDPVMIALSLLSFLVGVVSVIILFIVDQDLAALLMFVHVGLDCITVLYFILSAFRFKDREELQFVIEKFRVVEGTRICLQVGTPRKRSITLHALSNDAAALQKDFRELDKQFCEKIQGRSLFTGTILQNVCYCVVFWLLSLLTLFVCAPIFYCWRLRWAKRHTIIDGKILRFDGSARDVMSKWLIWLALSVVTVGVFALSLPVRMRRWATESVHAADPEELLAKSAPTFEVKAPVSAVSEEKEETSSYSPAMPSARSSSTSASSATSTAESASPSSSEEEEEPVMNYGVSFERWKEVIDGMNPICAHCGGRLQVLRTKKGTFALVCVAAVRDKTCTTRPISVEGLAKQFMDWYAVEFGDVLDAFDIDLMESTVSEFALDNQKVQFIAK